MKNMVDVCGGKMTLKDVVREFEFYMRECLLRSPKRVRVIVDIVQKKDGDYSGTIWIPKRCFGDQKPR